MNSKSTTRSYHYQLLVVVSLIGAGLRLWQIDRWSLWQDEVLTVLSSQLLAFDYLPINPIPYLAVKSSIAISGLGAFGARFIPSLVGILSIPLIYQFAKMLYNRKVGLWSALFLSINHWHLFWSQNSRSYIFTCFFAILVAICFYRAIESNKLYWSLVSLISLGLLVMSHLLAGVMLGAFLIYVIGLVWLEGKKFVWQRKLTILTFFSPFILLSILFVLPSFRQYLFSGWGHNEWNRSGLYIIMTLVHGVSLPIATIALLSATTTPVNRPQFFLVCYSGIPLVFFLLCSFILNVAGYYLFFTLPAYIILAARLCEQLPTLLPKNGRLVIPLIVISSSILSLYMYFQVEYGGRPRWKEAFEIIQTERQVGDQVVTSLKQMTDFYLPQLPTDQSLKIDLVNMPESQFNTRTWFIVDNDRFNIFDPQHNFRKRLQKNAKLVAVLPAIIRFKDRTISVYLLE